MLLYLITKTRLINLKFAQEEDFEFPNIWEAMKDDYFDINDYLIDGFQANYSLNTFISTCMFFDKPTLSWSSDGCRVNFFNSLFLSIYKL